MGYTRDELKPMMNVSGTRLPLRLTAGVDRPPCIPPAPGCLVVGAAVQLRLLLRDATVYAVGAF